MCCLVHTSSMLRFIHFSTCIPCSYTGGRSADDIISFINEKTGEESLLSQFLLCQWKRDCIFTTTLKLKLALFVLVHIKVNCPRKQHSRVPLTGTGFKMSSVLNKTSWNHNMRATYMYMYLKWLTHRTDDSGTWL